MVCLHGQREVEPLWTNEGESIFRDLVQTSFMDGPLVYFKLTRFLILLKLYFSEVFKMLPISSIFFILAVTESDW